MRTRKTFALCIFSLLLSAAAWSQDTAPAPNELRFHVGGDAALLGGIGFGGNGYTFNAGAEWINAVKKNRELSIGLLYTRLMNFPPHHDDIGVLDGPRKVCGNLFTIPVRYRILFLKHFNFNVGASFGVAQDEKKEIGLLFSPGIGLGFNVPIGKHFLAGAHADFQLMQFMAVYTYAGVHVSYRIPLPKK